GEGFFVEPRPHPVTAGLVPRAADARPPRVGMYFTRSMRHVAPPGAAPASELLTTTAGAVAEGRPAGAGGGGEARRRAPDDPAGPFVVAMAGERPRTAPSAAHGPRAVVVGSRFVLADENWRQPRALHGAAFFVDSALSWLAARPAVVDVPEKAEI